MTAAPGFSPLMEPNNPLRSRKATKRGASLIVLRIKMLERYCKALGIELFDESFYGKKAAIINTIQKLPAGAPVMSLAEAQSHSVG
jgi:ribosomal protein L10